MRRVTYQSVLEKASMLWTGEAAPNQDDGAALNVFLNERAVQFWERYFWPELCRVEKRTFRADWSAATTYGAPTATVPVEIYYPPARKYFQSLRAANLNNAPATGTDYSVENSAWWAEAKGSYSGDDWQASTAYAVGRILRHPADWRYYQCHTAHTSGASLDATKFGILTPFQRTISLTQAGQTPLGEVSKIYLGDPRVIEWAENVPVAFDLLESQIVVRGEEPEHYLHFRKVPPSWTGANWSAATTYALDGQAYDPTLGDFYKSLQASNTNHAVTDTAWWERIDFPYVFRDAAATAAYADLLLADGQQEKFAIQQARAQAQLEREFDKLERQQGQTRPLNVLTR